MSYTPTSRFPTICDTYLAMIPNRLQSESSNIYDRANVIVLREILRRRGMSIFGNKYDLIRRLWMDDNKRFLNKRDEPQDDVKSYIIFNTDVAMRIMDVSGVETLIVQRCDVSLDDFRRLMSLLYCHRTLHTLDLTQQSYNMMPYVVEAINDNPTITTLKLRCVDDLSHSQIEYLQPLADCLVKNITLKCLELYNYEAGQLVGLSAGISLNRGLRKLVFHQHCRIQALHSDIESLIISVRLNLELTHLVFKTGMREDFQLGNHIRKIGAILKSHPSLQHIELGMDIPADCQDVMVELRQMLTRNCKRALN